MLLEPATTSQSEAHYRLFVHNYQILYALRFCSITIATAQCRCTYHYSLRWRLSWQLSTGMLRQLLCCMNGQHENNGSSGIACDCLMILKQQDSDAH